MNYRKLTKARDEFLIANRSWFRDPTNSLYGKEDAHSYVLFKFSEYLAYRNSLKGKLRRWWGALKNWKPSLERQNEVEI